MRDRQSLNDRWIFQIDRKDEGESHRWFINGLTEGKPIEVPHIWQTEEEYVDYCGVAWYEKTFHVNSLSEEKNPYLCFGAVDFQATIWLNGSFVGEHEGGFTPFEFDLSAFIKWGEENRLTVRVYDPQDNAEIPIGKQGSWYTRVSGIWQDVYLEFRADRFIQYVHVYPDIDQGAINVKCSLSCNQDDVYIECVIKDHLEPHHIHLSTKRDLDATMHTQLQWDDPILWSPENPYLYDLDIKLVDKRTSEVIDWYTVYFGMRDIKFADGQLLLNGKPLFIRGALDQAYYPKTIYRAPSDEWIINEIRLAQEMGFNMLRKHIKVEIPSYLYWADRLGMLIWAEPPNVVKWSAQSRKRFDYDLRRMIERDMNHPSIIIWSLYNEEWGLEWDLANDPFKQAYVKELYDDIKSLDPTRLICDNSGWIHVKTDINDYHRYFSLPEQIEEWKKDLDDYMLGHPEQNYVSDYQPDGEPIIISEFGVWGLPSVNKIIEYYNGKPSWFINMGDDTHKEDFKHPDTALQNFEKYQLDKIFGDFEQLSQYSQRRMYRAVKSLIEEMRKRPGINGYVVTEFTDVEWETNGWLDALREKKLNMERASDFNGELVVIADLMKRNLWSGESQTCDIVISNHSLSTIEGELKWEIIGTDRSGRIELNHGNEHFIRLSKALEFVAPDVMKPSFHTLKLSLNLQGRCVAVNEEELTISSRDAVSYLSICPYKMDEDFQNLLQQHGFRIDHDLETTDVVVTSILDAEIIHYYRNGGNVLFLAEDGDRLNEKGHFTFRLLDQGESWNRTSSFNFVDPEFFEDVPLRHEMGWEMEGLFPDYIVPFSNYSKLGGTMGRVVYMFGNENIVDTSQIVSGYFQGWLGQAGGSLLVQKSEKGSLILTTWKLKSQYGVHPIGTHVMHTLIKKIAKKRHGI